VNRKTLLRKIAHLEFVAEQVQTELIFVDSLLRISGFPEGLETMKAAAHEVIKQEGEEDGSKES
jgi:hypothetical protein